MGSHNEVLHDRYSCLRITRENVLNIAFSEKQQDIKC